MKEIKAFIHKNRVADVIQAFADQGYLDPTNSHRCRNLNVSLTRSLLTALDAHEQHYSVELGQPFFNESKLELLCDNDQVDELVALLERTAGTGQAEAGWVLVTNVERATRIGGH